MNRIKTYLILVVTLFVAIGLSSSILTRAWSEPVQAPPTGNTPTPINTANNSTSLSTPQEKGGYLTVGTNTTYPNSLVVQNGMISALDGLRIEAATSDPVSTDGRVWIRTDANPYNIPSQGIYSDSGLSFGFGGSVFHAVADTNPSYFKVAKSSSTAYNIALVDVGDVRASRVMVETEVGTKALRNGYCGNGNIESAANEECDDRNLSSGDGCDGNCLCDGAWTIVNPASCTSNCGQSGHWNVGSVTCNVASPGCCVTPQPSTPQIWCGATAACCSWGWWSNGSYWDDHCFIECVNCSSCSCGWSSGYPCPSKCPSNNRCNDGTGDCKDHWAGCWKTNWVWDCR